MLVNRFCGVYLYFFYKYWIEWCFFCFDLEKWILNWVLLLVKVGFVLLAVIVSVDRFVKVCKIVIINKLFIKKLKLSSRLLL